MGTIQNAFNQMLGVAAGGIGTAKLLRNQDQSNKIGALNLAEGYENQATEFNKEVDKFENDAKENINDFYNTIEQLESQNLSPEQLNEYETKALESFNREVDNLYNIREGLANRKEILEQRKKIGEKSLGRNKFSNIKLSDVKKPKELLEINMKETSKRYPNAKQEVRK